MFPFAINGMAGNMVRPSGGARKAPKAPPALVQRAVDLIEGERASRTPEQEAAISEVLREIGAE